MKYEATSKYLSKIIQNDFKMPIGPLLMSPESMIDSFKTEVIHKKSEVFFEFAIFLILISI